MIIRTTSVDIHIRRWGPGGDIMNLANTAGTLLAVIQHGTACHVENELLPPQTALCESVVDINPMLALCTVKRVFSDELTADEWMSKTKDLWEFFGKGPSTTVQGVLEAHRQFLAETTPQFGDSLNLPALDAIDLTNQPSILETFRRSYHAVFETYEAFSPPMMEAFVLGEGWNQNVVAALVASAADPDSPLHALEMWWWHAVSSLAVPAIEAFLGAT